MIARLSVVDVSGNAGGHIIAGLETNTLLMQAVYQPPQRIQRMPQDSSAGAALDRFSVKAQFHRLSGEIQMPPVGNQRPLDPCAMAGVVGNERSSAGRGPAMKTAVDNFNTRQHAGQRIRDLIEIQRPSGWGQIAREAESEFRFNDAHEKVT